MYRGVGGKESHCKMVHDKVKRLTVEHSTRSIDGLRIISESTQTLLCGCQPRGRCQRCKCHLTLGGKLLFKFRNSARQPVFFYMLTCALNMMVFDLSKVSECVAISFF